jgi:hypothetical protein
MVAEQETVVAFVTFACLTAASVGTLAWHEHLPERYRSDDTNVVVRLVANIFVVMTSLVLSLTVNSAKNVFETVDRNVHTFATELILLDRDLRHFGHDADPTRRKLLTYVQWVTSESAPADDPMILGDRSSERLLDDVEASLTAIRPTDPDRLLAWQDAQGHYEKVAELRWVLAEESEGTIPLPLIVAVIAWLILIFASFGYRAPKNLLVLASFLLASALMAGTLYLAIDMDAPLTGLMQVPGTPLQRVLAEMRS